MFSHTSFSAAPICIAFLIVIIAELLVGSPLTSAQLLVAYGGAC